MTVDYIILIVYLTGVLFAYRCVIGMMKKDGSIDGTDPATELILRLFALMLSMFSWFVVIVFNIVKIAKPLVYLLKFIEPSEEKDNIQLQIDAIDNQTKYLQSEYDSISEGFANGDVEAAKANLYATDWMKNFSNAYSYRNVSETYKTNPWFEADFKKKQEIQRQEEWLANYKQREAHHREDYDLKVQEMQFNGVWGVPVGVTDFTEQDDDGVAAIFQSDLEGKKKELAAFEEMMKTKYNIADGTMSEGDAAGKTNRLFSQPGSIV